MSGPGRNGVAAPCTRQLNVPVISTSGIHNTWNCGGALATNSYVPARVVALVLVLLNARICVAVNVCGTGPTKLPYRIVLFTVVIATGSVSSPHELVTLTLKLNVPAVAGVVPVNKPFCAFNVSHAGRFALDHVCGALPVAASCIEMKLPTG